MDYGIISQLSCPWFTNCQDKSSFYTTYNLISPWNRLLCPNLPYRLRCCFVTTFHRLSYVPRVCSSLQNIIESVISRKSVTSTIAVSVSINTVRRIVRWDLHCPCRFYHLYVTHRRYDSVSHGLHRKHLWNPSDVLHTLLQEESRYKWGYLLLYGGKALLSLSCSAQGLEEQIHDHATYRGNMRCPACCGICWLAGLDCHIGERSEM